MHVLVEQKEVMKYQIRVMMEIRAREVMVFSPNWFHSPCSDYISGDSFRIFSKT